jgi:DNA (cytosine-5)-methyltransferase 1
LTRPLLLDLFCKAGGAGYGYHLAGFDVVGVDLEPQRNYPFVFVQADVLHPKFGEWISMMRADAIHASPPCQFATALNNDKSRHLNLIPATRALLEASGRPWVIENVEGAAEHLRDPVTLCGTAFGLGAAGHELQRHRLFELGGFSVPAAPACAHSGGPVIGVYGGHARNRGGAERAKTKSFFGHSQKALARQALGMDWGTLMELSEAIPPAYTEFLGRHLLAAATRRP